MCLIPASSARRGKLSADSRVECSHFNGSSKASPTRKILDLAQHGVRSSGAVTVLSCRVVLTKQITRFLQEHGGKNSLSWLATKMIAPDADVHEKEHAPSMCASPNGSWPVEQGCSLDRNQ